MNRDIYQAITARFVEQLKRGAVPWQKPWFSRSEHRLAQSPTAESTPCFSARRTTNPRSGSASSRRSTLADM